MSAEIFSIYNLLTTTEMTTDADIAALCKALKEV